MKIKFKNKTLVASLITSALLLGGCSDNTSEAKIIEKKPVAKQEVKPTLMKEAQKEVKSIYTKYKIF